MPNYKTHDKLLLCALPVTSAAIYYITKDIHTSVQISLATWLANRYVSPDLDMDSIMNKRWGWFYFIWFPYNRVIKHRSWISHTYLISATIRFVYLIGCVAPLVWLYKPDFLTYVWLGIVISDLIHITADKVLK